MSPGGAGRVGAAGNACLSGGWGLVKLGKVLVCSGMKWERSEIPENWIYGADQSGDIELKGAGAQPGCGEPLLLSLFLPGGPDLPVPSLQSTWGDWERQGRTEGGPWW